MREVQENIKQLLSSFKTDLKKLYLDRFDSLILFGSYSKNNASDSSDIDLMVVLKDHNISPFAEIDFTNELVFKYMMDYEKQISIIPTTLQKLKGQNSPLMTNIRKEGILI
ncbi:MAG: nucleotidyltransferase domain-containing protein [Leadbetterella sp.]|nr:nucleotidyltransferase domain-containing protein [Leadbetterella sp.]